MKIMRMLSPVAILLSLAWVCAAETPQVLSLEPKKVRPGTIVTATGLFLDKDRVGDAFLTDHRLDLQMKVLEQNAHTMKLRVPPFVKPGRQQLLLQTAGDEPKLLEQPVYVLVEIEEPAVGRNSSAKP